MPGDPNVRDRSRSHPPPPPQAHPTGCPPSLSPALGRSSGSNPATRTCSRSSRPRGAPGDGNERSRIPSSDRGTRLQAAWIATSGIAEGKKKSDAHSYGSRVPENSSWQSWRSSQQPYAAGKKRQSGGTGRTGATHLGQHFTEVFSMAPIALKGDARVTWWGLRGLERQSGSLFQLQLLPSW